MTRDGGEDQMGIRDLLGNPAPMRFADWKESMEQKVGVGRPCWSKEVSAVSRSLVGIEKTPWRIESSLFQKSN